MKSISALAQKVNYNLIKSNFDSKDGKLRCFVWLQLNVINDKNYLLYIFFRQTIKILLIMKTDECVYKYKEIHSLYF